MKILLHLVALSVFLVPTAFAQGNSQESFSDNIEFKLAEEPAQKVISDGYNVVSALADKENQEESTIVTDKYAGQYLQATEANLSKLYWEKGALDLANDKAIDNFLLINECDIYQKFHDDDFEWLRVREAARKMLADKKDTFSDEFKMVMPIDLGRYDMERKGFPLINSTSFLDLRRIEIGGNFPGKDICGESRHIEHYPRNVILIISKPFNYDFVKLDEHVAQAYIIRQKYEPAERPKELKNEKFNRLAFARMRIKFNKYQGDVKGMGHERLAILFGELKGVDIFEDANEKHLLTSIDIE